MKKSINLSEIKPIKIKLLKATKGKHLEKAFTSNSEVVEALNSILDGKLETSYLYYKELDGDIVELLESTFDATVHEGCRNGCYGSSTGATEEGYTIYIPLEQFQESLNKEFNEYDVNPLHSIQDAGGEVLNYSEEEIESYLDIAEESGVKIGHDNTYNHENEGCYLMCDLDVKVIGGFGLENEGSVLVSVRFHCGGDIRGNYTRPYLFKFDDIDEVYSALFPYREVEED